MATIFGTGLSERFNISGSFVWDGSAWVLTNPDGTTSGADQVSAGGGNDEVNGAQGDDQIAGQSGDDLLVGGSGNDFIDGGTGNDTLTGGGGDDRLSGSTGSDILFGGSGADRLDGGGRGDLFVFEKTGDSLAGSAHTFDVGTGDVIFGFTSAAETVDLQFQDKIDLRPLVLDLGIALTFTDSTASVHGIWYATTSQATFVFIDTSGDALADMAMRINSVETLSGMDFLTDATLPEVTNTFYGNNDGILSAGETVRLKVRFSEQVVVEGSGAPELLLNSGGTATYLRGSGKTTLTFSYTVEAGENAKDLAITSLSLNGSRIRDVGLNDADLSGATSNPAGKLIVDTRPPKAPTIDLIPASDSGRSSTDNITNDVTPTVRGTAEAFATINILDRTTLLGQTTANANGKWTFTADALVDGVHRLAARAIDAAGNISDASPRLRVTIDAAADVPTIRLAQFSDTGVSDTDKITNDATIRLHGKAEAFSTVRILDGATLLGLATASSMGRWAFSTDPLVEETHNLRAKAVDVAGNVSGASTPLTVTIDVTPPTTPVITGFSDDTGVQGDGITTDTTLTLHGSGEAESSLEIYKSGNLIGVALVDSLGFWNFDAGTLRFGSYRFTAMAGDTAGNSVTSEPVDVTITPLVIDLNSLSGGQGFIIQGDAGGDQAGYSVSSAGDMNGDGLEDLLVGAPFGDDGGAFSGDAYVVFGSGIGFGSNVGGRQVIDLSTLTADQGFIIQGDAELDEAGSSVSSAGDVNGDGFDDLIVGATRGDDGGTDSGEAYVVFGSGNGLGGNVGGRQVIDLTSLTADHGFIIQGDNQNDLAGFSVSAAGDINGDGFDDLIVGASHGDDGGTDAGEAYVVFGSGSGFGSDVGGRQVVDLTSLTVDQGFIIQGDAGGDQAGYSVSSAGDVNGDGLEDLLVGAPFGDDGGAFSGEAYVVFGSGSGFGSDVGGRRVIDLTTLTADQGFIIQGDQSDDWAGRGVASGGDVNGDGFDDIIVGAPFGDDGGTDAGEAYVVFGSGIGFGSDFGGRQVIDLTSLTAEQGFIIQGAPAGDWAGFRVSSAGDVNGDGFDDLIVGAPLGDDGGYRAGEAYVVFGSGNGLGGNVGGRQVIDLTSLTADQGFIIQGDSAGDWAGRSVSSAGDVNDDGFDDLILGAPLGDDGGTEAGEAYVIFGGAFGLGDTPINTTGTSAAEMLIGGPGDDILTGGGGADVFRGGAGNDILGVSDPGFADIDGGNGFDTLRLDGSGLVLDFTAIRSAEVQSIEAIDLTGTGDNSLVLSALDLFQLSDDTSGGITRLTVYGDAGDAVSTSDSGWVDMGTTTIGADTFDVFQRGQAQLLIQSDVSGAGILA